MMYHLVWTTFEDRLLVKLGQVDMYNSIRSLASSTELLEYMIKVSATNVGRLIERRDHF